MHRVMNQERPLSEITIEDNFSDHCREGPITSASKLFSPSDYQTSSSSSLSLHIAKNPITCMQHGEISPDDTIPLSLPLDYSQQQGERLSTSPTNESIYHNLPRDRKISNKSTSSLARWSKWFRKSDSSEEFDSQFLSQNSIFNVDHDVSQPVMKEYMPGSATLIPSYQAVLDVQSQHDIPVGPLETRPVSTTSKSVQRHGPSKLRPKMSMQESVTLRASQDPPVTQPAPRPRSSKISVSLRKKVLKRRLGSLPQVVPESTAHKHKSYTCEISFSGEESPITVLKELSQASLPSSTEVNNLSTGSAHSHH